MSETRSDQRPDPPRNGPARTSAAALALRLSGAGYDEVAVAIGLPSARNARDQAESALAARAWDDVKGRDKMRAENGARIERLLRAVWPKAIDGEHPEHLVAVKTALSLIDRHVRLYGLDAPTEIVVHTPTATEIDAWVAGMLGQGAGALMSMEADVIDVAAYDSPPLVTVPDIGIEDSDDDDG